MYAAAAADVFVNSSLAADDIGSADVCIVTVEFSSPAAVDGLFVCGGRKHQQKRTTSKSLLLISVEICWLYEEVRVCSVYVLFAQQLMC